MHAPFIVQQMPTQTSRGKKIIKGESNESTEVIKKMNCRQSKSKLKIQNSEQVDKQHTYRP